MALARIGYLGPEGSFSHEAVSTLDASATVAFETIGDLLAAVHAGDVDQAVVPLENAIEGTVSATIDGLVFTHDLTIQQELVLPIHLHLLAKPGVALDDVREAHSYVHALAQVRDFLHQRGITPRQATSTSQAAAFAAESTEPIAAVGSALAAEIFGLEVIAPDIADHSGNSTRFVVVGRDRIAPATGHDRTTVVCFQRADQPGSLYAILGRFAARDINLTKLESRPTKRGLGDYCFVMEFEGHVSDDIVADLLTDLQAHLAQVKFLGSYAVTGDGAQARRDDISTARQSAAEWVSTLRARVR
jgi:prephenate dehydratase